MPSAIRCRRCGRKLTRRGDPWGENGAYTKLDKREQSVRWDRLRDASGRFVKGRVPPN